MKAGRSLLVILFLLLLFLLSGCGMVGEDHDVLRHYVLEIEGGSGKEGLPVSPDASNLPHLILGIPEPAPGFESSRMAYVQVPHEVNYFAMSQWVETPARMLTPLLVQSLEESGLWHSVIPMPTSIRGDYRLNLTHVVLVQEFLQQPSRIRIAWRGQLTNTRDRHVIGTRTFEGEERTVSEDAYGGVLAAQQAVKNLLNDLNNWLGECVNDASSTGC